MLPPPLLQNVWTSKHGTVIQTVAKIYSPNNFDANGQRPAVGAWQNGRAACRDLVKAAEAAGVTLGPVGSGWSLSDTLRVPAKGWLVETSSLNEIPLIGLDAAHVEPTAPPRQNLVFAQSGTLVQRMHMELAGKGLSLFTSGASCGQTLAGCISTGTHGAALGFGAMQEMVRGINLIITGGESVWVEPASKPVVTAAWCTAIGARLIRDDDIFASAIVSFGTMGLVHAYLIEARPMYLLKQEVRAATLSQLYAGISRNGDTAVVNLPATVLPNGNANLVHLSVSIDPNPAGDACRVAVLYAAGNAPNHHPVFGAAAAPTVGDDALLDVGHLMNGLNFLIAPIVKAQAAALLDAQAPLGQPSVTKALCEFFPRIQFPGGGNSTEIGVDVNDMEEAVKTVIATIRAEPGAFPGIVSLRLVRGSSQILALTRFPVTCTIEMPIANTKATLPLFRKVWAALDAKGITYTLHWGQATEFAPANASKMYGAAAITRWKKARTTLLGAVGKKTFRNTLSIAGGLT